MKRTTTQKKLTPKLKEIKELLAEEEDYLRPLVGLVVQEVLEAEMSEVLGAQKGERTGGRMGYRSGYYVRNLVTRVGRLELRVPQDRQGRFSTQLFERYQRSEKALVAALGEMYVQGVSTRKVKAITEELCGQEFSASTISAINQGLDEGLERFMCRRLEEEYPYVILDARYERVRQEGILSSRAVLVAIGVDWEGRRQVLGVELANRESSSSWKEFLLRLKSRALRGVTFVVSDDHPGLKSAIAQVLPQALWQQTRCARRCRRPGCRRAWPSGCSTPRATSSHPLGTIRWFAYRRADPCIRFHAFQRPAYQLLPCAPGHAIRSLQLSPFGSTTLL
jgi:putative transposase